MHDPTNELWTGGPWEQPTPSFPQPPAVVVPPHRPPLLRAKRKKGGGAVLCSLF